MYTFHHGFWIYFFTRRHPRVWQYVFGAMLPDYIYVILLGLLFYKGYVTWSDLSSFNPGMWMSLIPLFPWVVKIDLIGHSVPIWIIAWLASLLPGLKKFQAVIFGWGTHLLIDTFTHGAYANFYLFPFSSNTVEGPVSYWEKNYWYDEYRLVNTGLMAVATIYMLWEWWNSKKTRK